MVRTRLNIGCRYSTPVRERPLHPTRGHFTPEPSQTQAPVTPATEPERRAGGSLTTLDIVARERRPGQTVYVGVTDPIDPRIETAEEVCERILEAAEHLGTEGLGSTDDCGFSPFGDDVSTARETAFAKIRARVEGTKLAEARLG